MVHVTSLGQVPRPHFIALVRPLRAGITIAAICCGAPGCASAPEPIQPRLPAPVESTTLGPGDVFQLKIVGEADLPSEYQVASDGTVDFPYIHRMVVAGLEPQEVQELVREKLIRSEILTDPSVVVSVRQYGSKRVTLLGQVQKPGNIPLTAGMTLLEALSMSGGFTSIAKSDAVRITRTTRDRTITVAVDVDAIINGRARDILLQAGDSIYVGERIF